MSEKKVLDFIGAVENEERRSDCLKLLELFKKITGEEPKLWSGSMVGFGQYHYVYESGREGDWFLTGFSPRKQNLTIYMMEGLSEDNPMMKDLGKYKIGKSCLYTKRLSDLNEEVLEKMIRSSIKKTKAKWNS